MIARCASCDLLVDWTESAVEERDDALFVFSGAGGDSGDVLAAGDLPDLLRLAGGRVEGLVRPLLGASLAVLAVDEEHRRGGDPGDLALQARGRKRVRQDRHCRAQRHLHWEVEESSC